MFSELLCSERKNLVVEREASRQIIGTLNYQYGSVFSGSIVCFNIGVVFRALFFPKHSVFFGVSFGSQPNASQFFFFCVRVMVRETGR